MNLITKALGVTEFSHTVFDGLEDYAASTTVGEMIDQILSPFGVAIILCAVMTAVGLSIMAGTIIMSFLIFRKRVQVADTIETQPLLKKSNE